MGKTMATVDITCDDGYKKVGTSATCSPNDSGRAAWTNVPTCEALSCPLTKIPNSNKEDGITGKVGDAVYVKCNGQDPSFVTCTGVGSETAAWTGFSPCFGQGGGTQNFFVRKEFANDAVVA